MRLRSRFYAALLGAILLPLAACSPGTLSPGAYAKSVAASESPHIAFAKVDATMAADDPLPAFTHDQISVSMPGFTRFTTLAIAQGNLRNSILQQAAWAGEKRVKINSSLISAAKDLIGVMIQSQVGDTQHVNTLFYQPSTNTITTGAALIEPASWAKFSKAVADAKGGAELAAKLNEASYPQGNAPAIGFNQAGDLVVSSGKIIISIPADKAEKWLTPFGIAALGGAKHSSHVTVPKTIVKPSTDLLGKADPASKRPNTMPGIDCTKLKCVALTFDDGPDPKTADLLKMLISKKIPVSFFTLGENLRRNESVTSALAAAGNEIGWHTATHKDLKMLSNKNYTLAEQEITSGLTQLPPATGYRPLFFRPPYGAHNGRIDKILADTRLINIMWSVDTYDWDRRKLKGKALEDSVISKAVNQAKPEGIILMHDIHATSREAAPMVIDGLVKKGFTLVTVGQLAGWAKYQVGKAYCEAPGNAATCW